MFADDTTVLERCRARSDQEVVSGGAPAETLAAARFAPLTSTTVDGARTGDFAALTGTVDDLPVLDATAVESDSTDEVVVSATRPIQCSRKHEEAASAAQVVQRVQINSYHLAKATLEFILSVVLLILAVPVIILAAVAVKLNSRGPAFYSQIRVGRAGRPYAIYKIRTMTHNCESKSGVRWSTAGDARITAVGRFLRRTHIDELPQLWNVLRGDMSLVGPRPERPEFVPQLAQAIAGYRERLLVRPGVTGLAQVQLAADTDLDSVRRKVALDLYYIENSSLSLDIRLILCTALNTAGMPFAFTGRLLCVPSGDEIQRAYATAVARRGVVPELQPA